MTSLHRPLCLIFLTLAYLEGHADQAFAMHAQPVAPGVYAVITPARDLPNPENRGWNSNSAFVITRDGVLVFDTGSSTRVGEALRQTISEVTSLPVRWIINSHAHGDHWLGNAAFKDTVDAVYSSDAVAITITAEGQNWIDMFNRMTDGATGDSEILVPSKTIGGRTELNLGGKRIIVFPSGNSHSPGDLVLWLPGEQVLITGDVVYSDRMPSTFQADVKEWISMLNELERMQPKVVVPGHGDITDVAGIVRLRELLLAFWDAVEAGYDDGKSDYEMVAEVTDALSAFEPHYPGLRKKVRRDISHVYLQVEAASFD